MTTLFIKNMVCNRCKMVIEDEFKANNLSVLSIELGKVEIENDGPEALSTAEAALKKHGFELMKDHETQVAEKVKIFLINLVDQLPINRREKLSILLSRKTGIDYSNLSKTFSRKEHVTIEKFYLKLKVEKAKELIQQDQYSFSEIADLLDYSNGNHLSKQFKNETGMSMSDYKKLKNWGRKPLDKII